MGNVLDRWWFRAFTAIVVFFLFQLFLGISRVHNLDDEKITLEGEVQTLERKRDNLRMDISAKEREIMRLEVKSQMLEVLIRDRIGLVGSGRRGQPMIYFITPTHFRPSQKADLTRLSYTLSHIPNLHWIIVEDADSTSENVGNILKRSRLPYTHINVKTRSDMKLKYSDPNWYFPRGVEQRNAALLWLRTQLKDAKSGSVYFGDDDNTYDLRLFDDIRSISVAGLWPVGIVGGLLVESPLLDINGSIVGFNSVWKPKRPFPVDMAAFAINLTLIMRHLDAGFSYNVERGYQESHFLTGLGLSLQDFEPKAVKCTKVYVWHTRTEKTKLGKYDLTRLANVSKSQFSQVEANALGLKI